MEKATEEGGASVANSALGGMRATRQERRLADSIIWQRGGSSASQVFLVRRLVHRPTLLTREPSGLQDRFTARQGFLQPCRDDGDVERLFVAPGSHQHVGHQLAKDVILIARHLSLLVAGRRPP